MTTPRTSSAVKPAIRRPRTDGPLGLALIVVGFAAAAFLLSRGAWPETLVVLILSLLGWRLRGRVVEGRIRERSARDEVLLRGRLLDAVGEAVVGCSGEGRVVYWNLAAERMLGWRRTEVVGRPLAEVLPGIGALEWEAEAEAEAAASREATLRHREGRSLEALVTRSSLEAGEGAPPGAVLVLVDLTRQKAAEREQRVLAEVGAVLAAGLGAESTLVEVGRRALPTLGDVCLVDLVEEGELRRVATLHAARRSEALAEVARAIGGDDPRWADPVRGAALAGESLLLRLPTGGGSELERRYRAGAEGVLTGYGCQGGVVAPLRVRGRTLAVLSFLAGPDRPRPGRGELELAREVAERVAVAVDNAALLEEAQLANRSKADFLAVMSHELRTPLTTVMGYADLLERGVPEPLAPAARQHVERIRTAAWHLLRIIEQILTYARLDAGRDEVDPGRLSLAAFVRDTAALLEPVAGEKGVAFSAKAPDEDLTLVTDATKLRQILLNLLSNAVKFTDSGVVALTAWLEEDTAVFEVRDTGVGIAAEHLERVFDPFWQADQSPARTAGGTGIGLSVARRLARLLGGGIEARSTPGEGTTFTVRIPAEWRRGGVVQRRGPAAALPVEGAVLEGAAR